VAWSEGLLAPAERTLLQRLAVFVGGATLESIEAVCVAPVGAEPLPGDVLDHLGALLDQSLVRQREEPGGNPRFYLMHVIREYALELLAASGGADALSRAFFDHYLALGDAYLRVELSTWASLEMKGWFERLEREYDNIRAALGWAYERAMAAQTAGAAHGNDLLLEGLRLAGDLLWFWSSRGYLSERRTWLERFVALDAPDFQQVGERVRGDREALRVYARALYGLGMVFMSQDDLNAALEVEERSLRLFQAAGDVRGSLNPLGGLANLALHRGELERAASLYAEDLKVRRSEYGPIGTTDALVGLADLALVEHEPERALPFLEEALSLAIQAQEMHSQAIALEMQASIALQRGQTDEAAGLARRALELVWASGRINQVDPALEHCAVVMTAQERHDAAACLFGAADALRKRSGWGRTYVRVSLKEEIGSAESRVHAALGEEGWSAAFTAGQALSLEEAYQAALQVSPVAAPLPPVDFSKVVNPKK
ncbi:MAG TPA: hypothetical protein VGR57_18720, partial [Ktedonobacterales bacterium]|nr:hypothetical protein [Ktedonobacterales bacterium]